jgi:RNAse (barnase) inhibitor barstar
MGERVSQEGLNETRIFFIPMHEQPVFPDMGLFKGESYPIAEDLARTGMYLPSSLGLKKKEKMDANEIERKCFRREKSIHERSLSYYFGIDIEAVWDTVRNNIPSFKKQIVNVLKSEKASKRGANNE